MRLRAALLLLAIATFLAIGLASASPPRPTPASAPPTDFSAERALAHLTTIAARPHPTGSPAADDVRAYVSAQLRTSGFTVEEQEATSVSDAWAHAWGAPIIAARVRNVIARRAGTSPGPGVLLLAHYDSRELAPGASDDGFGVAALLETARALAASPPLRHDVWVVFTEGEEQGLMGALAFFAESPVVRDVGLVLNFEARGDRGPAVMFETSPGAGSLVDVLAREAPRVVATSISQEVYKRMPNSTDFTVALGAKVPGLNFANIDGYARYHQVTDTVANASLGTLQHHGSYALPLARAFGNRDVVAPPPAGEEVYFRFGPVFVHYASALAVPLAVLAFALLLAWAWRAVRGGGTTVGRIGAGAAVGIGAIVAGLVASLVLAFVAGRANSALPMPQIRASVQITYAVAHALVGAGASLAVLGAAQRRVGTEALAIGAMLGWAVIAVGLAIAFRGGSYLATVPSLVAGAASFAVRRGNARSNAGTFAAGLLTLGAAVLVLAPAAELLNIVFGAKVAVATGVIAAQSVTAGALLLEELGWRRAASALAGSGALCFAAAVFVLAPFDAQSPRPESLLYAVDADRHQAWWLSLDDPPLSKPNAVLAGASRATLQDLLPREPPTAFRAEATVVNQPPARVELLGETPAAGGGRTVRARVVPPPGALIVRLSLPPKTSVVSATVDGKPVSLESDGWLDLQYFGPPREGFELTITTAREAPLEGRLIARLPELPPQLAQTLGPRPNDEMPSVESAMFSSDAVLVGAAFRL